MFVERISLELSIFYFKGPQLDYIMVHFSHEDLFLYLLTMDLPMYFNRIL